MKTVIIKSQAGTIEEKDANTIDFTQASYMNVATSAMATNATQMEEGVVYLAVPKVKGNVEVIIKSQAGTLEEKDSATIDFTQASYMNVATSAMATNATQMEAGVVYLAVPKVKGN